MYGDKGEHGVFGHLKLLLIGETLALWYLLEREQIGEATRQRLAAVKAQGKHLGRKPASRYQVNRVREYRDEGLSLRQIARNSSLSYGTVYNIVKQKGCYADI